MAVRVDLQRAEGAGVRVDGDVLDALGPRGLGQHGELFIAAAGGQRAGQVDDTIPDRVRRVTRLVGALLRVPAVEQVQRGQPGRLGWIGNPGQRGVATRLEAEGVNLAVRINPERANR